MGSIALSVPTAQPGAAYLPGGQCYVVFSTNAVTVREIIAAKVGAELRKARLGGPATSSIGVLLPPGERYGFSPLKESLCIAQACEGFTAGRFLLVVNDAPMVALDDVVTLKSTTTRICFLSTSFASPTVAAYVV